MKAISKQLCFLLLYASCLFSDEVDLSTLPFPYNTVRLMPFRLEGWYHNQEQIEHLIKTRQVKTIVEVGSWMGLSTHHMASLLPEEGRIYAVDTFEGTPGESHSPEVLETLYDQFLSNVVHAGLVDKIIPIKMESLKASRDLEIKPDLVYLDATHEYYAVLADLNAWFPRVKGHGVLCGDDWAWGGDQPVARAVTQFAEENDLNILTNGWFWSLEEKK